MKNKFINFICVFLFILWTGGAIWVGHEYFPKTIQLPAEILSPSEHEISLLAQKMAEPEIVRARQAIEFWNNLPPKVITIPGNDSISYETVELFPEGTIDISKSFDWDFSFQNPDRVSDSLRFTVKDKLTVTAYRDSSGNSFIGYENYTQEIDNFSLIVSPKIFPIETQRDKYSFFIGLGLEMSSTERFLHEEIYQDYSLSFLPKLGILFNNSLYVSLCWGFSQKSEIYGIAIEKKFWRIRGGK